LAGLNQYNQDQEYNILLIRNVTDPEDFHHNQGFGHELNIIFSA
jgi:hypothetical protein